MSLGTAMCCCPVVHTSWNPNSSCRNSMPILCLGTGCWFVFVDAPGNLICRQTVCAALVATSARTLEERRSGGLKEFQNQRGRLSPMLSGVRELFVAKFRTSNSCRSNRTARNHYRTVVFFAAWTTPAHSMADATAIRFFCFRVRL